MIRSAALLMVCAASVIWVASCASRPTTAAPTREAEPVVSEAPALNTNAPAAVKASTKNYYTCAMHPEVHFQNPDGKCPICGMPLVPASEIPDEPMN